MKYLTYTGPGSIRTQNGEPLGSGDVGAFDDVEADGLLARAPGDWRSATEVEFNTNLAERLKRPTDTARADRLARDADEVAKASEEKTTEQPEAMPDGPDIDLEG